MKLQFQGQISYCIRKELYTLLYKHIPNVPFKMISVNRNTIGFMFRFKDRLPDSYCSNIVYCLSCKAGYVRYSSEDLKLLICEHKVISYRNSIHISNLSFSVNRNHLREIDNEFCEKDFMILYKAGIHSN